MHAEQHSRSKHAADLRRYAPDRGHDAVVAIGLAMFFVWPDAKALLARIRDAVRPGGVALVNVLIEGTTYLGMFTPEDYCLFGEHALEAAVAGWRTEYLQFDAFPAPENTVKRFCPLVARRPDPRSRSMG